MERERIDCPVCGKPAWWIPVSPWYDCDNSLKHPICYTNWVNDELDRASRIANARPEWMKKLR